MDLVSYFESIEGTGVLATADSDGKVNTAIYARPHVVDANTVAFIMRHRLSYSNLSSNPHGCYLFMENTAGHKGVRLYLTKKNEDDDAERIAKMSRKTGQKKDAPVDEARSIVYFNVDSTRPLLGG